MTNLALKGGYLDFSHLIELEKIYITEIYIYLKKKKKNHQELRIIKLQKNFFDEVPLEG